jgi:parallel beta-helix repeat protein
LKESETRRKESGTKEEVAMYYQINPTETFRERHLALLMEAENRRLARQLRSVRGADTRSSIAAVPGFLAALVVVAALMLLASSSPAHAESNFFVNSTADFADANITDGLCTAAESVGECTFRAAIQQANAVPGADNILFEIPSSGVATIKPSTPLPQITDRVTIDAYTHQQGTSPNTLAQGTNAVLKVELDGSNTDSNGLVIKSGGSGSVIRGLVINRFGLDGVLVGLESTQNRIEGNFIGTDPSGTLDVGNFKSGVEMFAPTSNTVTSNTVGGSSPAARNLISGNGGGVRISTASSNRVEGNLIGTEKDGTTALGNSFSGVAIVDSPNNTVSSNTIAFNGGAGVGIAETPNSNNANANGNLLAGNSIFSNVEQGIDLGIDGVSPNDSLDTDIGPNTLQNKPLLTSARTSRKATTIKGTLNSTPNKSFLVQFFSNASGEEGQKFMGQTGVTTDSSGNASFIFKPALKVRKGKITATAIETVSKNTSEFSAAKKVVRKRR